MMVEKSEVNLMLYYTLLFLGIICTVIFLTKRKTEVPLNVAVLKGVTSIFFIATAFAAFMYNDECTKLFAFLIVMGGIFGAMGDVALDLKYVFSQKSDEWLYIGFTSFLIGHVFYASSIILNFNFEWYRYLISIVGGVLFAILAAVSEGILKVKYGKFKKITVLYIGALGFSINLSFMSMLHTHFSAFSILLFVGMVMFITSDAFLSGIYFSTVKKPTRLEVFLNHLFYYIAQFVLASTLLVAHVA